MELWNLAVIRVKPSAGCCLTNCHKSPQGGERALLIKMVMDRGVNRAEFLERLRAAIDRPVNIAAVQSDNTSQRRLEICTQEYLPDDVSAVRPFGQYFGYRN